MMGRRQPTTLQYEATASEEKKEQALLEKSFRHHEGSSDPHYEEPVVFSKKKQIVDSREGVEDEDQDDDDDDEDDADEEEGLLTAADPLTYSDDSASLSDAYFFPQENDGDLARPLRYRDPQDPLLYHNHHHPYPHYGSMFNSGSFPSETTATTASITHQQRASSPLWVDGSTIQEDSEMAPAPATTTTTTSFLATSSDANKSNSNNNNNNLTAKERRRQRRQQQKLSNQLYYFKKQQQQQQQQQQLYSRERAVTQVRGQKQDHVTTWQDSLWAVLFVVQLILVLLCAIVFGFGLVNNNNPWQQQQRGSSELSQNDTTGEMQYTDDTAILLDSSSHHHNAAMSGKGKGRAEKPHKSVMSTSTSSSVEANDTDPFTFDYQNVIALVSITGFYACILTYVSFGFMLILSRSLIQVILVFSVIVSLAWGTVGLTLDPYGVISILGFAALLLTLGYTIFNWNRIPFAATNLYTALCAMRCTADITILGLLSLLVAFGWCVVWSMAFVGIVNYVNTVECDQKDACEAHVTVRHLPLYLLLLLSFYWTNAVIKNVVRVTVASAIGSWWYHPRDIGPFCTVAVQRPLLQSVTKSLGSICLGSLVIQVAQFASLLCSCCCCMFGNNSECRNAHRGRAVPVEKPEKDQEHNNVHEEEDSAADSVGLGRRLVRLIQPVRSYLRSCNRWSFTYIGLYGYGFREAGERAIQLFETREWLDVVRDNLIQNVLLMASVVIGGSTGTFAVVLEEADGFYFSSFHMPTFSAFVIGLVLGYLLSNILLLGVVGSAVNTVLVCFAAGPFEFDMNHPLLSREMREVWSQQVWEPSV